jgi:hypothetical protein
MLDLIKLCGNAKLIGVIVPGMVIKHIPSKLEKGYSSKYEQEGRE